MGLNAEAAGKFLEGKQDLLVAVRADLEAVRDIAVTSECGLEHIGPRPQEVVITNRGLIHPAGEREIVRGGIQVDRYLARRDHEPQRAGQCQQERACGKDPNHAAVRRTLLLPPRRPERKATGVTMIGSVGCVSGVFFSGMGWPCKTAAAGGG